MFGSGSNAGAVRRNTPGVGSSNSTPSRTGVTSGSLSSSTGATSASRPAVAPWASGSGASSTPGMPAYQSGVGASRVGITSPPSQKLTLTSPTSGSTVPRQANSGPGTLPSVASATASRTPGGIQSGPSMGRIPSSKEMKPLASTLSMHSMGATNTPRRDPPVAVAPSSTSTAPAAAASSSHHTLLQREKFKFTLKDLVMHTTVGTGTFGRVRVVQYKPTKAWYALKILKKSEIIRLKQLEHIKSEVQILSMIHHPFIVNMLGHIQDEKRLYMLFEYVPGGELFSHLRREGRFSNDHSRFYAAQIILAFEYLHTFNIVYRDLKPENLLLSAKGHIKITDFGFAKIVEDRTWTVWRQLAINPFRRWQLQLCGTPEYLAPEIIQSKGHNKGVDWWAIGILIYEMLAGYPPFFDETPFGIYQKILAGKLEFPKHFTPEAKDLIRKLLVADRTKRLGCLRGGATDIKEHPWFARMSWDAVFNCTIPAPFLPKVKDEKDTSNFDDYPDSGDDSAGKLSAKEADLFVEFDAM